MHVLIGIILQNAIYRAIILQRKSTFLMHYVTDTSSKIISLQKMIENMSITYSDIMNLYLIRNIFDIISPDLNNS